MSVVVALTRIGVESAERGSQGIARHADSIH